MQKLTAVASIFEAARAGSGIALRTCAGLGNGAGEVEECIDPRRPEEGEPGADEEDEPADDVDDAPKTAGDELERGRAGARGGGMS